MHVIQPDKVVNSGSNRGHYLTKYALRAWAILIYLIVTGNAPFFPEIFWRTAEKSDKIKQKNILANFNRDG